jgi:hypothetical protein
LRIFGLKREEAAGGWRRQYNEKLHTLNASPRRMMWVWHIARMGTMRNAYILVGKPEGKRPLGRPRLSWEDNNRISLMEVCWEVAECMHLAQDQ